MSSSLWRLGRFLSCYERRKFSACALLRKGSDQIPEAPVWGQVEERELPPATKVTSEMASYLEQLSLVNFENNSAIKRLESAIRFADQLLSVNTEGVEPMDSVLQDYGLPLCEDVEEKTDRNIVNLAEKTFEGYYVVPAGNIPYTGYVKRKTDPS